MKARDIMTEDLECVTPQETVSRAAQIMRDEDVGVVPVVDDRNGMKLRGLLTDRDIAVRCVAEGRDGSCTVSDIMSTRVRSVRPDDDMDDVMDLMANEQVRRVPVCEGDRIVGIIAQADLALEVEDEEEVEKTIEKISEPGSPR